MKRLAHHLLIIGSLMLLAGPGALKADAPLPTPVGRVVWIKGELDALMPNNERRVLQKESVIYVKDTLITDMASQAQIVFTDNTLMTFREGTRFFVNQYAYNPNAGQKSIGKYVMTLIEGGFRTITGLIAKSNPPDYQVNTPVATIGVRGTEYEVYVKGTELFIGYYHGTPCVTSEKRKDQTLCLDKTTPYGYVANGTAVPVPAQQQPAVFRESLKVIPAVITPFTGGAGAQTLPTTLPSTPITSFCITQ